MNLNLGRFAFVLVGTFSLAASEVFAITNFRSEFPTEGFETLNARGWAVDVSGDLAVVGTSTTDRLGGAAYVYNTLTGDFVTELVPSDPRANALFGFSVAIDNGLAIVASGQRNVAYVFDAMTGQQLQRLEPVSDTRDFIRSVAIDDGIAVLGLPTTERDGDRDTADYGAAFVYDARTGNELHRIDGPVGGFKRQFGLSVAIEENSVVVSSPSHFSRQDVYVYDAITGDREWSYGYATSGIELRVKDVAADGDRVVVGLGSNSIFDMPEALVFDRESGNLLQRIDTRVVNENDRYKSQVDISGNRVVVGSWGTKINPYGYYVGDVHLFDATTGEYEGSVGNPFPDGADNFGFGVAIDGEHLIVGASSERESFLFRLVPEPTTVTLTIFGAIVALTARRR